MTRPSAGRASFSRRIRRSSTGRASTPRSSMSPTCTRTLLPPASDRNGPGARPWSGRSPGGRKKRGRRRPRRRGDARDPARALRRERGRHESERGGHEEAEAAVRGQGSEETESHVIQLTPGRSRDRRINPGVLYGRMKKPGIPLGRPAAARDTRRLTSQGLSNAPAFASPGVIAKNTDQPAVGMCSSRATLDAPGAGTAHSSTSTPSIT